MKTPSRLLRLGFLLPVILPAQPLFVASSDNDAVGIYVTNFDATSGALAPPRRLIIDRTFFFGFNAEGSLLYASGHQGDGDTPAVLRSYSVKADQSLVPIDTCTLPGRIPLHLSVSPDDRFALVANYLTASVVSIPLHADGSMGAIAAQAILTGSSIHPQRQDHSYPHSVNFSPDGKFAYVADRGTDRIGSYAFNRVTGQLAELNPPVVTRVGAGPRHLSFHPDKKRLYVINEINGSLTPYRYDARTGRLSEGPSYPTTADDQTTLNTSAEVKVHPHGRFVYATNRGPNTVAVFSVGEDTNLRFVQRIGSGGDHPRYMALHPDGRWLIVNNKNSSRISVFALDPDTGRLTATDQGLDFPSPADLHFLPQ